MLVDWDGRVLSQASSGPGEQIVVGPIDVPALRIERERRRGHDMRGHLRSEVHTYMNAPHLAPAGGCPAPDELASRIARSKGALEKDR